MHPEERAPIVEPIGRFASGAAILLAMIGAALAAWTLREVVFILFGALVLANGTNAVACFLARKVRIRYALGLLAMVTTGLTVCLVRSVDSLARQSTTSWRSVG
jgi:predicted PurR-regulated permease PerM